MFEDFRLSAAAPEKIREIGVVGTAYDSVYASDITYVSTPITSGAALYRAMDAAGITDPDEFRRDKAHFSASVIGPNLAAADAVAHRMVDFGGAVIAPAAFEARSLGWGQDEYMGLWLDVIERRATRLALVDGWEYSNGGAEEYLQALLMQAGRRDRSNMLILDAQGACLSHGGALRLLANAVENLLDRNFKPKVLARVLLRTVALHGMVRDESAYGQLSDMSGRTVFTLGDGYMEAAVEEGEMRGLVREIAPVLQASQDLLPDEDAFPQDSRELAPGIVRREGRESLSEMPARIITSQQDDT